MDKSISINKNNETIFIERKNIELDILTYHQFGIELTNLIKNNSGLYIIYDATEVTIDTPGEVKLAMAEWIKENKPTIQKNVISTVFVFPSMINRLVMRAVFQISNPIGIEYKIVNSREEAIKLINKEKEALLK